MKGEGEGEGRGRSAADDALSGEGGEEEEGSVQRSDEHAVVSGESSSDMVQEGKEAQARTVSASGAEAIGCAGVEVGGNGVKLLCSGRIS